MRYGVFYWQVVSESRQHGHLCKTGEQKYELSLTNLEVRVMFQKLIKGWFGRTNGASDEFVDALLNGDIKAMNYYMNKIALATFSYFDVGNKPSEYIEPERFYHGFVLGLMVGQREDYAIKSNRESDLEDMT